MIEPLEHLSPSKCVYRRKEVSRESEWRRILFPWNTEPSCITLRKETSRLDDDGHGKIMREEGERQGVK